MGEDAFAQSGSSNGGTVSNEIGQFDLAVDGDAKAHFSFRRETNGTGRDGSLYYVTNTTGSWSSPELLAQGNTAQAQAETNTIDTDANNKVHIVHSDYQNNLYYTTNVSGSFVTSQINGNAKGETYTQHTLQINENGDKFLVYNDDRGSPTRLNYAYQLAGTSGSNWTVGTAFTPNDVARGGNYFSGLMTKDRRIITLFDNSTTDVRGQCKEFQRDLWYATATVQNVPVQQAPTVTTATPASVASTSAILGGNVTADGGASVTERGIVYSASNNPPTTANATKLQIGSATGSFSQTITGLSTSTTYYTRAYAINSAGTSYGATQQFTTTAPLAASISARTNVTCNNGNNGSATLAITGGTSPYTIDWKPGNPTGDGTTTITGLSAGSYTAIVTDTYGATAQAIATITQPPALVLSISPSTTTVCGGTVTLTASSTNAVNPSFAWTGTSPTSGPMVTVSSTGTYSVTLTDGSGCKAVASAAVTINPVPNPTIVGLASAYCKNATAVTLTGNPSGGKFTIDSNMATTLDPAVLLVGQHTVVYSYTNSSGCSNTASQNVTINALPTVSITGLASAYCQDATAVTLAPLGSPAGGSFTIDGNSATVFNPIMLSIGDRQVVYRFTDNNSCTNSASQTVTVKEVPTAPVLVTQAGNPYPAGVSNLTISQNVGNVILTVSSCTGGTINWNGGNATTLAVSTSSQGTQSFTATCTRNGCTSPTATATVTVVAPTLKVLSRDPDNGQLGNNTIKPYLILQNVGRDPFAYSNITLRYWLTTEDNVGLVFQKNFVAIGQSNLTVRYVPISQARQGATGYIEYSFGGGAGNLAPMGDSGPLELQVYKENYSSFFQPDDYSYINNSSYTLNPRITAYQNGTIFYGVEPTGTGSSRVASQEVGSGLAVKVLGNPVVGPSAEVEISGVSGQSVELKLVDLQGKMLHGQTIRQAGWLERVSLPLGTAQGMLLLEVSTATQRQQIKLVRP
ncbi:cellulose binding domain-containing protein [Spirosoma oryzicola]|uniref:cellulose binding domain-containing protein n=1 Tax=Spirosoma oryzicola TaxID=2898794 RepID=UPI001E464864|nr:cellulose binding domain-containing protein [Spirosoma oryzicola]UHG90674.1 hypothetical protein LQ777_20820 [Spirosoma oryzicola]